MNEQIDFTEAFRRLADTQTPEETTQLGGVNLRLVRVAGGGAGRWDSHATTTETVMV